MFKRTQDALDGQNSVRRQHYIPQKIHAFAVGQQLAGAEQEVTAGRGRGNLPTLADIYYALIVEGLELVRTGQAVPAFVEVGRPVGTRAVQIKFPTGKGKLNEKLERLKKRAEKGEFEIKPYREISLISVAITLMQLAIDERRKRLVEKIHAEIHQEAEAETESN